MLLLHVREDAGLSNGFFDAQQKRLRGCAQSFSAHVRWCEHGAPFDEETRGFLSFTRGRGQDKVQVRSRSTQKRADDSTNNSALGSLSGL
jgi:hypothetical protein